MNKLKKTKSSINEQELALSLSKASKCGCGTVCDSYHSYITLENFKSTGGTNGYSALYVVDGALVIKSVDAARTEQEGYKI